MKDGHVIYKVGYAEVSWCEKCQDKYTSWPRLDELKRKHGKPITRQCCEWNKRKRAAKLNLAPWPPVRNIEDIFPREPESIESLDAQLERWSRE